MSEQWKPVVGFEDAYEVSDTAENIWLIKIGRNWGWLTSKLEAA